MISSRWTTLPTTFNSIRILDSNCFTHCASKQAIKVQNIIAAYR